jgi:uncharacterized protein (DUF608 family)
MEDQLVGQYLAEIAGLGELVDRKNVRASLASIYASFGEFVGNWRAQG